MSCAVGFSNLWQRDVGYAVPAKCDHPDCEDVIDRGLSYLCQHDDENRDGCGLYFCQLHLRHRGLCERCDADKAPFEAKPDLPEWVAHKLGHPSWREWREENPTEVAKMAADLIRGKVVRA